MVLKPSTDKPNVFNLFDTNGRRYDVLNALKIYLENIEEIKTEFPFEAWDKYPTGISQFLFYEKTLEKSKGIFNKHSAYDKFAATISNRRHQFLSRKPEWVSENFPKFRDDLDKNIEQRARHYSSNLVRIGFAYPNRNITSSGYSFLSGNIKRDSIEELLPLDNINIILLRQLLKLKIFSVPDKFGIRKFYSPFLMALSLLMSEKPIDKALFQTIVQGLSPYSSEAVKTAIIQNNFNYYALEDAIKNFEITTPDALLHNPQIEFAQFKRYFKSSKDSLTMARKYFEFYKALGNFRNNKNKDTYNELLKCLGSDSKILNKAFGYGKSIFHIGNAGNRYSLEKFLTENSEHPLIYDDNYIDVFFKVYTKSKWVDVVKEYSDTTIRLLGATGLFKFENLPELSYKELLLLIFDEALIRNNIFGEITDEEYTQYEISEDCYFGKSTSFAQIFNYSHTDVLTKMENVQKFLGVTTAAEAKKLLDDQKRKDFLKHIHHKYTKKKIIELLPMFSDRKKDSQIKKEVNDTATVPTIYEYITGIAWYYISNEEFDLYSSLNLTLNADFEPVIHAGGGNGDIIIHYDDIVLMLEVTLMNKYTQKRGEWEPVLRHSVNLKAACEPKETITFFIADELDYNTINIWRAVAAAALESTNTHKPLDGVVIMPFTNKEILAFLEDSIYYKDIISTVKKSFAKVPRIADTKWHDDVISSLIS